MQTPADALDALRAGLASLRSRVSIRTWVGAPLPGAPLPLPTNPRGGPVQATRDEREDLDRAGNYRVLPEPR